MRTAEAGGDAPDANINLAGHEQSAALDLRWQGGRNPQDDLAARNLILVGNSIGDGECGRGCQQLRLNFGNRSYVRGDLLQDVCGYRGQSGSRAMIAVRLEIATAYCGLPSVQIFGTLSG